MASFDENEFIEAFVSYYNNQQNEKYDFNFIFKKFFKIRIVQENKIEEVYNHYFPKSKFNKKKLFDKLHKMMFVASVLNNYDSEADTDREADD